MLLKINSHIFDHSRTETREYTDDSRGLLERISYGDVRCWKTYDKYGRLQYQGVELNGCYDVSDIKYKTVNNRETNQVQEFRNSVDCFTYTYDKSGNITEIYNWGNLIKKYTYSIQGRLTTEENLSISQKTEYTYSQQGDITQKTRYIKDINGNYFKPATKSYTYSTDGKYLLTAYNGSACVYDALGNPTTYKGKTLVWGQGKRLLSYDGLSFEYDALGRRTKKGDVAYYYDSQGRMVKSSDGMEFLYAGNEVIGFIYSGATYIYCKDVFGNITAILDESENVVVKYDYDAWGNHRVLNSAGAVITDTQHIGHKNPFRYRGYYYDSETGLYYLKSRYYDPETCRFINMDSVEYADPTYLHGLNLYAYCNNNPIMYVDSEGRYPQLNISIDGFFAVIESGIGLGLALSGWSIKTAIKPNNIGLGVFQKNQARLISNLNTASKVLSKVSTGLSILSTAISVINNISNDVQNGYTTGRIASNAVVNTLIYGGLTFGIGYIGGSIGGMAGSIIPGLGNVVGAAVGFAVGSLVGGLLDLKIEDKSIINWIRDGVYEFWKWLFG